MRKSGMGREMTSRVSETVVIRDADIPDDHGDILRRLDDLEEQGRVYRAWIRGFRAWVEEREDVIREDAQDDREYLLERIRVLEDKTQDLDAYRDALKDLGDADTDSDRDKGDEAMSNAKEDKLDVAETIEESVTVPTTASGTVTADVPEANVADEVATIDADVPQIPKAQPGKARGKRSVLDIMGDS